MSIEAQVLNPWLTMWTRPRATIQQIVSSDPQKHILTLAAIGGISQALDRASMRNLGDEHDLGFILAVSLIGGPIAGVMSLYLFGALLKWTGGWLGGAGSFINIRAAMAWSYVPLIWALLLWVPQLVIFGKDLFSSDTPNIDQSPFVMLGFGLLAIIVAIWTIVVFLKALGQVQGFSAWRALGNTLAAAFVVAAPIILLVLVFARGQP